MLNKRLLKFRYIANFSIFAGIVPVGISGVAISSVKNFTDVNGLNKSESVSKNTLRFGDKYISLRSNPMNNFVSLTTTKIGSGNIKEQFTYALCDTATSQEGIKYGKNSGIAKLDYNGNVVALWTLPKTGRGQENEYIYTTNIVFGDTEETVYVLCGISNPAQALNSVYRGANVPTKINYDASANLQDPDTAYFHRNELLPYAVFNRDNTNKYKVDITGYSFANYPKIKIYKLNANDLTGATKYDFEFPPAATGNLNDPLNAFNEYDKTIIAGFGGGQHLNYWSTNSTWVTDYKVKNDHDKMSLMNSSFFHYLQFGQTFDYVGNSQFMMVPTYVGIDPNLGGLYSLVNEGMTRSLASFSSYPSLYNVFYKYKGKPSVNTGTKTIDFSQDAVNSTQYQYLDGSGKKVNVTKGSEFALDESVIRLILLSIGYFLPNHQWNIDAYGVNMEEVISTSTAGYLLSSYGVIGFSPSEPDVVNRYKLYVFNRNNSFGIPAGQFIIKSMIVNKDKYDKKRYMFFLASEFAGSGYNYPDAYNGSAVNVMLYGIKDPSDNLKQLGFTWDEFVETYDTIQNSQNTGTGQNINLTGVNANSYDWTNRVGDNQRYYENLNSILTVKNYFNNSYPLGWYAEGGFLISCETEISSVVTAVENSKGKQFAMFPSYSGSKYVSYGEKALITDPIWANKLEVIGSVDNFSEHAKRNYEKSYEYGGGKYANTAEGFNKISTLFVLPENKGFGYLTYNNEFKLSFLKVKELGDSLKHDNFKEYSSEDNSLHYQSVVPVGETLYTSLLNSDGTISNNSIYLGSMITNDNSATMWIIIGVCSAAAMFIALGLGIGIPMRKNAKLQLATTKLSNKKIDMLSTTVAKSFKKLAENTSTLLKNQPKALAAATPAASTRPMGPQQPTRPVGPRPMGPQQPTRPVGPRPMGPQQPTRPVGPRPMGPQQPTRPVGPRPMGPQQPTRPMGPAKQ